MASSQRTARATICDTIQYAPPPNVYCKLRSLNYIICFKIKLKILIGEFEGGEDFIKSFEVVIIDCYGIKSRIVRFW